MATEYEMTLKNAVEQVLRSRYSEDLYSLNGYKECATCLQQEANQWILYNGERGNRYDIVACDTLLEACIQFFRMMTHNHADIISMEGEFIQSLKSVA